MLLMCKLGIFFSEKENVLSKILCLFIFSNIKLNGFC